MIQQFHSCVFIWRKWKHYLKYLHSICIEKLFTTAKPWKQPKCSSMTWMNKENVMYTYNRILFNQKKEGSLAMCNNMDWLWGHSLVAQTVNNLPSVQETRVWSGLTWVGKIPWRREWLPTSLFLPGEFHEQRILVGYSPWCHKESDTAEWLTLTLWGHYAK